MSKIDSFFNLSPLNTVSRKVISFSDISAVNLMVGGNLLSCSINRPFCFPNTNHVIILRRIGPLFCSLKRVHASINMSACTLFNEQKKGPNLLSISTWSVLGKQNVQAKRVYWSTSFLITVPEREDIANISSPFFWLGFALLYQRCFNFSHGNIGKWYCHFSSHGDSMCLEIVLPIELERIFV